MSKAEKIIVKLIEKNQQLEEDAERYQKLFLEMEQKVWNLEDELKELRAYPKKPEIGGMIKPADLHRFVIEELVTHEDEEVWKAAHDLGNALGLWPLDDEEPLSMTDEEVRRRLAEPIAELEDDDLETLIPEQDCGD